MALIKYVGNSDEVEVPSLGQVFPFDIPVEVDDPTAVEGLLAQTTFVSAPAIKVVK